MIRTNGSVQYLAWYFFVIAKHTFCHFQKYHGKYQDFRERWNQKFVDMEEKMKTVLSLFRQLSGVHWPAAAIISSDKTDFHSVGTHLKMSVMNPQGFTDAIDLPLVIDSGHGFIWKIIFVTISEFDKFVSKVPCGVRLGLSLRPCLAIGNIIEAFDF